MEERKMRALSLVFVGCLVSTGGLAQGVKSEIATWRTCADARAAWYAQSAESAPTVARLATLACSSEKRQAKQALARQEGEDFAEEYIEAVERRYIDHMTLNIVEMRLTKK